MNIHRTRGKALIKMAIKYVGGASNNSLLQVL